MSDEPKQPANDTWYEYLVAARQRAGKTQAELAEDLGMSQSAIADWEKGKTRPRAHLWDRIDRVLGADLQSMLAKEVKLITPRRRRVKDDETRYDWLDMPESRRFSVFIQNYDYALLKAELDIERSRFAQLAFNIWIRETRVGTLRTQEARLMESIETSVELQRELQEIASTTIEQQKPQPER